MYLIFFAFLILIRGDVAVLFILQLDGMAGNYEFDPLGFSEYNDVKWMREAELKNGRVAMLAVVGWLVTSAGIHLPSETGLYSVTNPIDAFFHVGPSVMGQIFCFCGALESLAHKGKMAPDNMFDDGRKPGNFGAFAPPLGGKDMADMEVKELKNGRLAMIAMGGLVHQQIIDGTETFGTFPISNIWNLPGAIGGL